VLCNDRQDWIDLVVDRWIAPGRVFRAKEGVAAGRRLQVRCALALTDRHWLLRCRVLPAAGPSVARPRPAQASQAAPRRRPTGKPLPRGGKSRYRLAATPLPDTRNGPTSLPFEK
jgi:hypothetical protein